MESASVVGDGGQHQLAHQIWVAYGDLQRDASAQAVAENISVCDAKLAECGGCVVGHLLHGQWAINIGGMPMRLLFEGDHLPGFGQRRPQRAERGSSGRHSAMQQRQRLPRAMDLVIHMEAIHVHVTVCHAVLLISFRLLHETATESSGDPTAYPVWDMLLNLFSLVGDFRYDSLAPRRTPRLFSARSWGLRGRFHCRQRRGG